VCEWVGKLFAPHGKLVPIVSGKRFGCSAEEAIGRRAASPQIYAELTALMGATSAGFVCDPKGFFHAVKRESPPLKLGQGCAGVALLAGRQNRGLPNCGRIRSFDGQVARFTGYGLAGQNRRSVSVMVARLLGLAEKHRGQRNAAESFWAVAILPPGLIPLLLRPPLNT